MLEQLITRYGRPRIWLVIITSSLLLGALIVWVSVVARQGPDPIGPAEALANGGHVVKVFAHCQSDGAPVGHPTWCVITHAGRPPAQQDGHLSGNMAQVIVGDDWIGQVEPTWEDPNYEDEIEITDFIGTPFGWHDRVTYVRFC